MNHMATAPHHRASVIQLSAYASRHAAEVDTKHVSFVPPNWWLPAMLQFVSTTADPIVKAGLTTLPAPWNAMERLPVWVPTAGSIALNVTFDTLAARLLQAIPSLTQQLAIDPETGLCVATSTPAVLVGPRDSEEVGLMQSVRGAVQKSALSAGAPDATVYSYYFIFVEMDAVMAKESVSGEASQWLCDERVVSHMVCVRVL